VTLNGAASSDPSQSGQALSYLWTAQSAPSGSALSAGIVGNTVAPSFTPDVDGAYTILLTVSDNFGSATDTIRDW
jgi:hypothetical protein